MYLIPLPNPSFYFRNTSGKLYISQHRLAETT
jgi:hypothetical protein